MSKLIPFDSPKVPAAVAALFGDLGNDELVGNNAGGGFPVISIKGKVFHIVRGDEKTLITKPGDDDPAGSIEVVIVKANADRSKVFYSTGYVEGSVEKPTCYSNDGIAPAADATEPQAKKCAVCPHNQWGAKITEDGKKAKACADSRRLAVAAVDAVSDPMLLRVPAASMKNLEEYGKLLATRKAPSFAVVTKVSFDYTVAHPLLKFAPVGWVEDQSTLAQIKDMRDSDIVSQIIGTKPMEGAHPAEDAPAPTPAAAPSPAPAAAAPAKAAKPAKAPEAVAEAAVKAAEKTKKVDTKVEEAPAADAAATMGRTLESMIEDLDFDD